MARCRHRGRIERTKESICQGLVKFAVILGTISTTHLQGADVHLPAGQVVLEGTYNGTGHANSSAYGITLKDDISFTLSTIARWEVYRDENNELNLGDRISVSASADVGGGGSQSVEGYTYTWQYLLNPNGFSQDAGWGGVDLNFQTGKGTAWVGAGVISSVQLRYSDDGGLQGIPGFPASQVLLDTANQLQDPVVDFPTNGAGWTKSVSAYKDFTDPLSGAQGTAKVSATVQYIPDGSPVQWEAVIAPGPLLSSSAFPAYDDWVPQGDTNGNPKVPGNLFMARVYIQAKNNPDMVPPRATYSFTLSDVSREPGIGLNFPPRNTPARFDTDPADFDLRISSTNELDIAGDGQSAELTNLVEHAGVVLECFDGGAYGKLKVVAKTEDGQTLVAHVENQPDLYYLPIPKDDNDNQVADAWEKSWGIYGRNLPPEWDGVDTPAVQKCSGDGISLYERYRGFKFGGIYERLTPTNKYAFIYDADGMVAALAIDPDARRSAFPAVSECRTRFVDDEEWTGSGAASTYKRIVNFNSSGFAHATDQHALNVEFHYESSPLVPSDWDDLWKTNVAGGHSWAETNNLNGVLGMTWPDYTTKGFDSPVNTLLITIYPPKMKDEIRSYVVYHTWAEAAFANYASLPAADQAKMRADEQKAADKFIQDHAVKWRERYYKRMADVSTHELGHGLGVPHHDPTESGSWECVMRYFVWDCPRNAADRFELVARAPWPHIYCVGGGCWGRIKVTDK